MDSQQPSQQLLSGSYFWQGSLTPGICIVDPTTQITIQSSSFCEQQTIHYAIHSAEFCSSVLRTRNLGAAQAFCHMTLIFRSHLIYPSNMHAISNTTLTEYYSILEKQRRKSQSNVRCLLLSFSSASFCSLRSFKISCNGRLSRKPSAAMAAASSRLRRSASRASSSASPSALMVSTLSKPTPAHKTSSNQSPLRELNYRGPSP